MPAALACELAAQPERICKNYVSIGAKPSANDPMVSLGQVLQLALMIWRGLLQTRALLLATGKLVGLIWGVTRSVTPRLFDGLMSSFAGYLHEIADDGRPLVRICYSKCHVAIGNESVRIAEPFIEGASIPFDT